MKGLPKLLKIVLTAVCVAVLGALIFTACDKPEGGGQTDDPTKETYLLEVENGFINGDESVTSGRFPQESDVTLTADLPEGKEFVSWVSADTGEELSSANPYTFKLNSDLSVRAVARDVEIPEEEYVLTVENGFINGDDALVSGSFPSGSRIELTAIVPTDKRFAAWTDKETGTVLSRSNPYVFELTSDLNAAAVFEDVSVEPVECRIDVVGGANQSGASSFSAMSGSEVTITATETAGSVFVGWSVNNERVSADNPYTFTVTESVTIRAETVPARTVTVVGGKIDGEASAKVAEGSQVTVVADARADEVFAGWYVNGVKVSDQASYAFTVEADITVTARFEPAYRVTVEGGRVEGDKTSFAAGTPVTVVPEIPDGHKFVEWRSEGNAFVSDGGVDGAYTFEIERDIALTAVTVKISPEGSKKFWAKAVGGTIYRDSQRLESLGSETQVDYGATYFLSPTTPEGWSFWRWEYRTMVDGRWTSTVLSYTADTNVNRLIGADAAYVAVFTKSVRLTVIDGYIGDDVEQRSATLNLYASATVHAFSDPDRLFIGWYAGEELVADAESPTYTFTLIGNTDLTARYRNYRTISADNALIDGEEAASKKILEGDTVTLRLLLPDRKHFTGAWMIGTRRVEAGEEYSFKVTSSAHVYPVLKDIFAVTVVGGKIDGAGTGDVIDGNQATVVADVRQGERFDGWKINGNVVAEASSPEYTFTVTGNVTITAVFVKQYSVTGTNVEKIIVGGREYPGTGVVFDVGTEVTVYPQTIDKKHFYAWSVSTINGGRDIEPINADNSYVFTLTATTYVTAKYKDIFTVTVYNADGEGAKSVSEHVDGTSVTLTAKDSATKAFKYWSKGSGVWSEANPFTFTVTENLVVQAIYDKTFLITILDDSGTIVYNGTDYGSECRVFDGGRATIKPKTGLANKRFLRWEYEDGTVFYEGDNPAYTISSVKKDYTLRGIYQDTVSVTVKNGTFRVDSDETYFTSTVVDVGAKLVFRHAFPAGSGREFQKWVIAGVDGLTESTDNPLMLTAASAVGAEGVMVEAVSYPNYTVTVENADGTGTSLAEYTVREGKSVALTAAAPVERMNFLGWYVSAGDSPAELLSTDTSYSYAPGASATVEARWSMLYSQTSSVGYAASLANIQKYTDYHAGGQASFIMPGLSQGENLVVQGIDYSPELNWMFLCGYVSPANGFADNSVICVMDMSKTDANGNPGLFIKEILLRKVGGSVAFTGHAGGIAVTKNNIFLSNSNSLLRLSLDSIVQAKPTAWLSFQEEIKVPVNSSYATYSDGVLWVGEFEYGSNYQTQHHHTSNTALTAWTVGYIIDESGAPGYDASNGFKSAALGLESGATPDYVLWHGEKIQGMAAAGNKIVLSKSWNRNGTNASTGAQHLLVYDNPINTPSDTTVVVNGSDVQCWLLTSATTLTIAPMSEDLAVEKSGDKYYVYVSTESASYKYRNGDGGGNSKDPTDIIWKFEILQS